MTTTTDVLTGQREALAAALSTVDAVTGYAMQPGTIGFGDAWPVWNSTEWTTPCLEATTYNVFVAIPAGDLTSTTEAIARVRDGVHDALTTVRNATVQRAEPVQLAVNEQSSGVAAILFTVVI